jgi:hypothetical protein
LPSAVTGSVLPSAVNRPARRLGGADGLAVVGDRLDA